MSTDTKLEESITDALDWDEAEKLFCLEGAIKTLAERALEYNVVAFRLVKADSPEEVARVAVTKGAESGNLYYNGSLPMLIGKDRYLCFYRLRPEG